MTTVVSIKFRDNEKAYFFEPNGTEPKLGQKVVVETAKGLEMGECCRECHEVEDDRIVPPLRPVVRVATEDDLRVAAANKEHEAEAFEICRRKIAEHGLEMKLVDVERSFDGNKILFFFTSDGRVDFRELVKDLASVFRTRIELRQIGVRDEAKMLGGLGICGRPFCCSQFLTEFQPVSTKMAKVQSMSLNPSKISGSCGRLMCCLRYEHEAYEDMIKHSPKTGAFVETESGYGTVSQVNLLRHQVKVKMDGAGETIIKSFDTEDIAVIPGGRPAEGEPLPHILQPKVKPVEEDIPDPWKMPELFADNALGGSTGERSNPEEKKKSSRSRRRRSKSHRSAQSDQKKQQDKPEKSAEARPKQQKAKPKQTSQKQNGAKKPAVTREGAKPTERIAEKAQGEQKKASSSRRRRGHRGGQKNTKPQGEAGASKTE